MSEDSNTEYVSSIKDRINEVSTKTYYFLVALGVLYQRYPDWMLSTAIVICMLNTFAILGIAKTNKHIHFIKTFKTCVLNTAVGMTFLWAVFHLLDF